VFFLSIIHDLKYKIHSHECIASRLCMQFTANNRKYYANPCIIWYASYITELLGIGWQQATKSASNIILYSNHAHTTSIVPVVPPKSSQQNIGYYSWTQLWHRTSNQYTKTSPRHEITYPTVAVCRREGEGREWT